MTGLARLDIPKGRLYAVGDIHGCADELSTLLTYLTEREKVNTQDLVVFIGDYVDRGPRSKDVIAQLIDFRAHLPATVFLKGNHEDMMCAALGLSGQMGSSWVSNGGDATLQSYGLKKRATAQEIATVVPTTHLAFLEGLTSYVEVSEFVFVHAGLKPLQDLESQVEDDLFWIRDEFVRNTHRFGKTVVFGHTPFQDVFFHMPYKIGIDTGLVFGNKLSCIELTQGLLLQLRLKQKQVVTSKFPFPFEAFRSGGDS